MKLISSFIKAEDDAKQISNVNEGIVKDVKRMFAGKTAKDRARQEIEKAATASIIKKDEKKAAKHFRRFEKFDELANGGVKLRKVAALSDDDLVKYSTDINKGVAGWDPEYTSLRTALKAEMKKRKLNEDISTHAWGPLDEGVADKIKSFAKGILSPKKKSAEMLPLTKEHRDFIKKNFKSSNVDIKWTEDGEYVLTHNAKADQGTGAIYFRNEDGTLKASVAFYRKKSDVSDPKARPLVHSDEKVETLDDVKKLKDMLGEAVSLNEGKVEDSITDFKDRQSYLGLKKQEADRMAKSKVTKDLVKHGHLQMAKKYNADAETILQKYKNLKEAITYTDINDWKQAVKNSYPQQAKRISFLSKMQGNKMTVSAEIKGEDRCYGVWDQEDDKGVVLSEAATWSKTGKTGTHDATGEPTFEWQELDSNGKATGNREWRNAAGKCMDRKKLKEAGLKGSVNKLMDKAAIKKAELDQELGDEDTKANTKMKFGIEIDGKLWKKDGKAVDFPSKVAATKAALSGSLAFKKTTVVPL
jgi:hypothetical protein